MDFFAHQDRARRDTARLVVLFGLGVAGVVAAVYLAAAVFLAGGPVFDPGLFLLVGGLTGAVILLGSAYKSAQLRQGGGRAVAESLGGRLVEPGAADPRERRLLNIVEEMAIASGIPVPPVYVLDEEGINAFAAGYSPQDAVVAVTTGSLEELSRDELQGVVAHEFSHILNGDMRVNIRLMGVLHGLLLVGLIGQGLFRLSANASRVRSKKNDIGPALMLLGLAVMVAGYVGVFFGNLIKAAVSRSREFLADASAVQFTRNPDGIGGALKKIAGFAAGSRIAHDKAGEASHLFFSAGLGSLFATHPPIGERIRRIDPAFDGQAAAARAGTPAAGGRAAGFAGAAPDREAVLARVGRPGPEQVAGAARLIAGLPREAAEAARTPAGARACVHALLLDGRDAMRRLQLERLRRSAGQEAAARAEALGEAVRAAGPEARLPLAELAVPGLRRLGALEYRDLRAEMEALIRADGSVSLFEFMLSHMVERRVGPAFGPPQVPSERHRAVAEVAGPCATVFSCLARAASPEEEGQRASLAQAGRELGLALAQEEPARAFKVLPAALEELRASSPALRRKLLAAGLAAVHADRVVTVEEAELLRLFADSLDCPLPPVTAGRTGEA